MSVDYHDDGVATQPTGYLSGWKCHLCVWAKRSISHNLMDPNMLITHGQQYHYIVGEDQTLQYLRKAIYENRDIHYNIQPDPSPVLVSMGLHTPISDLQRDQELLVGTPAMNVLLQDYEDDMDKIDSGEEDNKAEHRILTAITSTDYGDWKKLFPEVNSQVADIGGGLLTSNEIRELQQLDAMLEEIKFGDEEYGNESPPSLETPHSFNHQQKSYDEETQICTSTRNTASIDCDFHEHNRGDKMNVLEEEPDDHARTSTTRYMHSGSGKYRTSSQGHGKYKVYTDIYAISSSPITKESGEAGELLDIYEAARGF